MKALVAVANYPNNSGNVSLMYVHSRNRYYVAHGIDVTVLNFNTKENYIIDGINVISLQSYMKSDEEYDVLICHAANIRNHYFFLKKNGCRFRNYIFFFHGHEVLRGRKVYSKPYDFIKYSIGKKIYFKFKDIYDVFKLRIWRRFYVRNVDKSHYVFVSKWMLDEFLKWTQVPYEKIKDVSSITYNCIGKAFEDTEYNYASEKKYDFITIRSNLDGSKYCVDLVNDIARNNPNYRFLLVGKGRFFDYYEKADNLEWRNQTMKHDEIIECLNASRCALMPTRTDAQGLMMCEMASTGIPLITSDISVCHEVFEGFPNVAFINNDNPSVLFEKEFIRLLDEVPYQRNTKYYNSNTSRIETELILSVCRGNK